MKTARETLGLSKDTDPVLAELVEEITNRIQSGKPVDLAAYERDHPEQIEQLQKLLPAIEVLAEMKDSPVTQTTPVQPIARDARLQQGVLGDYRILREVGRGGMGVVYEAEQVSLGRKVALKVLPFAAVLDNRQLQRFKSEAQAAARLHHTHIVPVFSVGSERGVHYYAMQYIDGHPLSNLIRELRQLSGIDPLEHNESADAVSAITSSLASGRFSPADPQTVGGSSAAASLRMDSANSSLGLAPTGQSNRNPQYLRSVANLGVQAAEALEHAHRQGVVHRDVKPSNLLLDTEGHLWITDFGLAHCQTDTTHTLTMPGDLLGTIRYMSPEQALAKRVVIDHRTDIYSLGVTLYELLTLEPVFTGQDRQELMRQIAFEEPRPPRRLNEAIPADLQTIVLKATEKNPDQRYETAQDVADDLERFLGSKPILAKPPTLLDRGTKWCRRHRSVVVAAVALLVISVIGLTASTFLILQEQSRTDAALAQAQTNLHTAEEQRQRAEENFQKARDAVDRMLTQAAEKLADVPHMEQVRRALLEDALEFYQGFLEERGDDPDVRSETGGAYRRAGEINELLGQHEQSKESYTQSVTIFEELVDEFPDQPDYREELAKSLTSLGPVLSGRGDVAIAGYRKAIALLEELVADHPDVPRYQAALARAQLQLGDARACEHGVSIFKMLAEEFPETADYLGGLASGLSTMGDAMRGRRKWYDARDPYEEALAIYEKLFEARPDMRIYREGLTWSYRNRGRYQLRTVRYEEAEKTYRRVFDLSKALAADFPGIPKYREWLALFHQDMGAVLTSMGRTEDAAAEYATAVAGFSDLAADFPEKSEYRMAQSRNYMRLGDRLSQTGRLDEGEEALRQALGIRERLAVEFPEQTTYRRALSQAQRRLAWQLAFSPDAATRNPGLAVELATKAAEERPQAADYWTTLGVAQYRAAYWTAAIRSLENALQLGSHQSSCNWLFLAMAHWQLGEEEQARQWYDKAVERMEWLEKYADSDPELRVLRSEASIQLGWAERPAPGKSQEVRRAPPPAAIQADGKPFFVVAASSVEPHDFAEVAEAGYNTLSLVYHDQGKPYMDEARRFGLRAIAHTGREPDDWAARESSIRELCANPALLAWHMPSNPLFMNVPVADIENARNHIRAAAGDQPVELRFAPMIHTWPKTPPYGRHCDVISIEPYPYWASGFCTGGLNLRDRILAVPYWTDEAMRLAAGKPVWVLIQAHTGWGLRPTPAQFRSSAYLAVNHGASGIIVAGYQRRLWGKGWRHVIGLGDPQLSDLRLEAARVASELRQLSPAILAGAIRDAVEVIDHVWYIDVNAFASPEHDRLYIVAVNTTNNVVDPIFQIHLKTEPTIEILSESLVLEHNEGRFSARFAPYETHVYVLEAPRFDPEAAELLGVDKRVTEEQEPGED